MDGGDGDALMQRLQAGAARVEATLEALLPASSAPYAKVIEAMRYSSLDGGKRLRPFLAVESAALFDVPEARALRAGAAVEMVHCYSLVHDDLPAMDDSDLRRGRLTAHKRFDEAIAILAGDGLLTEAFAVLADSATHPSADVRIALVAALAQAGGKDGMVGGQMVDISPDRHDLDLDGIKTLQALKTGALIGFSCQAGAILGQASAEDRARLTGYAADLGLCFQIVDDLLDVTSTAEDLGKPAGQDIEMGKATFVGMLGVEGARAEAERLAESAAERLASFGPRAQTLRQLTRFVLERSN
ncbi:polyprenyl synthetase family protein [Algihabitans albus]|uniref:polyprenyl synthetase family protein n=1 Tax=Algihabitans albus TaxID=2164067 RepID=UPI000E5D097F|nr:farnesyl diphosphate synthase [Algihabitans albus]